MSKHFRDDDRKIFDQRKNFDDRIFFSTTKFFGGIFPKTMFFRFLSDFLPETMFFIENNDFFGNHDFSIYNGSYMIFSDIVIFNQRFNLVRINGENRILEKSRMRISPRFIWRSCCKLQGTNRMSCSSQILNIRWIGAVFKYKRAILRFD